MGFFKKIGKKLKSNFGLQSGVGAFLPSMGLSALDFGKGMVEARYEADQQSRLNREMFDLQKAENIEAFNRNVARSDVVYERDVNRANEVWQKEIDRADEVYNREKSRSDELWHRQNEYNSPKAQMQRFEEAGLNPLLAYTQGTPGIASPPAQSQVNQSRVQPTKGGETQITPAQRKSARYRLERKRMLNDFLMYFNIKNAGLRNQNIAAENALIKARAREVDARAKINEREYDLFKDTDISVRDAQMYRIGGRIAEFLRSLREERELPKPWNYMLRRAK